MGCHALVKTRQRAARAGARELGDGRAPSKVDQGPQAAGALVLRPQRAPRRRCRLRDLPRSYRPDGRRSLEQADRHAVVPRVPPRSHAEPPAEGPDHEHVVDARRCAARLDSAGSQPPAALARVPQEISERRTRSAAEVPAGSPVFRKQPRVRRITPAEAPARRHRRVPASPRRPGHREDRRCG